MKVTLIEHTPNPEKTIAIAAKMCYSDANVDTLSENLDNSKINSFVEMLSEIGHESPIEHVSFTFGIEGVSRTFLAQVTRHRIASFSVQSQRYVKKSNFVYITPPEIEKNKEALNLFEKSMKDSIDSYNKIADTLEKEYLEGYLKNGIDEKKAKNMAEKKAIEDARFVLPNACETKMVVTMNARSLKNFFKLRCCNRAQWEIKAVADDMLKLCYKVAPSLFKDAGPSCVFGVCSEGKMTCGKANEMKIYYQNIKNEIKE